MIIRLHGQVYNKLLEERKSIHYLEKIEEDLKNEKAPLVIKLKPLAIEEEKKKTVNLEATEIRKRIFKIDKQLKEVTSTIKKRKQGDRINLYLHDANPLLNKYHLASAEYTEQVRSLNEKLRKKANNSELMERIQSELLSLRRAFCHLDNALSRKFIELLCPEKKLIRVKGSSSEKQEKIGEGSACALCDSPMEEISSTYTRVCTAKGCGYTTSVLLSNVESDKNSFELMSQMTSTRKFTYKRINHFRETLRQAQGKSNAHIKPEVREKIKEEIKKRRLRKDSITPEVMRKILSKIRYSDYYEEAVSLTLEFNKSFKPININAEQEEKLCFMFTQTEKGFEKIKVLVDKKRKNYMSYPSTARRLCQLCDWPEFMESFPLLKDEKLRVIQDKYWELLCALLGWKFIPTVGNLGRMGMKREIRILSEEEEERMVKKPRISSFSSSNSSYSSSISPSFPQELPAWPSLPIDPDYELVDEIEEESEKGISIFDSEKDDNE